MAKLSLLSAELGPKPKATASVRKFKIRLGRCVRSEREVFFTIKAFFFF